MIVAVSPANAAPTGAALPGAPDPATGVVTGTVTATDPDGDPLTYTGSTTTAKGTVIVDPDGTFTYTPTADARHHAAADTAAADRPADSFTSPSPTPTAGSPPCPSPSPSAPPTPPTTGTAVTDTPDPATGRSPAPLDSTDPDGDTLTYSGSTTTAKGTVIVNADGTFTYTPTEQARHNAATDNAGTDAHPGHLHRHHHRRPRRHRHRHRRSSPSAPTNTAPTGTAIARPRSRPPGWSPARVTRHRSRRRRPDLHRVDHHQPRARQRQPDGSFTYTPTAAARHNAAADTATAADKQDTFTITVDDGHGGTIPVTVTVTISPANTAPTGTTVPGAPDRWTGVVTGTATFTDADNDPLTYSGSSTTSKGTVAVNPDGTFTYTPTATARHNAAADTATTEDKQDVFTLTVNDGFGSVQNVPVTVAIGSSNRTPDTIEFVVPQPDPATGLVNGSVRAALGDPDGDPLTHTLTSGPAKGSVTVNSTTGAFVYTPTDEARHSASADTATAADKQDSFTVTINDGHGWNSPNTVIVAVSPTNAAPTGAAVPGTPDPATGVVTGTVTASDPDGDPLTYTGSTTTAKGTVTVNPDGTFTYTPTEAARHNAAADTATTADTQDNFAVTINDAHGGTVPVTATVAISPTNAAPTGTAVVGTPDPATGVVTGTLTFTDADNDTLTYAVSTPATNGTVTLFANGAFSYEPTETARH